ncbi:MAG: sigma-70 family RNA polymerase sigma factor [Chloroflexota bacterium]
MQNEENLVRRAQCGEGEAFTQLYETYFDRIYRYVTVKVGDRVEAEDLTQEVFIKALRSLGSFRWKGVSFSAWLFRLAHNHLVDYWRKKGKRIMVSLEDAPPIADNSNPQLAAEQNLEIEQVVLAAEGLTPAQKEVISLRFAADLPIAEVARIMGKSEGAIKALQHSAIVSLRKKLAGR